MEMMSEVLRETTGDFGAWVQTFFPRMLAAGVILLFGWLLAKLIQMAVMRVLRFARFDLVAERGGINGFLQRGNVKADSVQLLGRLVYWILLILTLLSAINALGISEAQT